MRAANGNRVEVQPGRRLARGLSHNRLMLQKKDPKPKLGVFRQTAIRGVWGEPPDLKYTPH
jgi:hypothetical protein